MKAEYAETSDDKIVFDKLSVLKSVEKDGKYEDDISIIKKWDDDEGTSDMFVMQLGGEHTPFTGVVNGMFQREGYALNYYPNGDNYFGYYSEDERNKHGLYSYVPEGNNKEINSEYYFGLWRDNLRDGHGIYLWLNEKNNDKPLSNFDEANFDAYVGNFEKDEFTKGTLMSKKGDKYFVYHGTFDKEGKKEGENCFYYSAELEELFYGTFKGDKFIEGYIGKFDDEGNLNNVVKKVGKTFVKQNEKNLNEFEEASVPMFKFRNTIMNKDYFGDLYKIFADTIKFRDENMNDLDILNSDRYIDIMNATVDYNKATIFRDIEKYVENL